jgi:hypothetical protein
MAEDSMAEAADANSLWSRHVLVRAVIAKFRP